MGSADKQILFNVAAPSASILAAKAAGMSAGSWDFIPLGGSLTMDPGGGSIFEYTEKAGWDPVHQKIKYIGAAHTSGFGQYVEYRLSSNDFFQTSDGEGRSDPRHGFAYQTCDPNTGDFYGVTANATSSINRYTDATGAIAQSLAIPPGSGSGSGQWYSLEWHPGLFGGEGGLVALSMWQCQAYRKSTASWSTLAPTTGTATGDSAGAHAYVIKDGCVYAGLGSQVFKVTAAGAVTQIAAPPVPAGCWSDPPSNNAGTLCGGGLSTSDLVQFERDGRINAYSAAADAWTAGIDNWRSHIPDQAGNFLVVCPIVDWGVIACLSQSGVNTLSSKLWLWKR